MFAGGIVVLVVVLDDVVELVDVLVVVTAQ